MRTDQSGTADEGVAQWSTRSERGSTAALRAMVWCFRRFGRVIEWFLPPIAAYFLVFDRVSRGASRAYLARIASRGNPELRHRVNVFDVYRHFRAFADAISDRFSFWTGSYDDFDVVLHGREHIEELIASGRGAVLLGAHLGSFDVLRVIARDAGIRVNVVMFTANAQKINRAIEALDPNSRIRVIEVDSRSIRAAFEIRSCVARGEFVAMLADRLPPGGAKRVSHTDFLGDRASFPEGPFVLPIVLGVPLVLCLALKAGKRRYDVYLELLGDDAHVSPRNRSTAAREYLGNFARRLEYYCELAPLQWFNFYDFWADAGSARE